MSNCTPEELENYYNEQFAKFKTDMAGDLSGGKIVNVFNSYPWKVNYNKTDDAMSGLNVSLPHVYVREYRQNLSTFASTLVWLTKGLNTAANNVADSLGNLLASANNQINNIINSTNNTYQQIINGNGKTLSPYNYMYSTDTTNCLEYIFPLYEQSFLNSSNSFGESPQIGSSFHESVSGFIDVVGGWSEVIGTAGNVAGLFSDKFGWNDQGIYIEKPKYYQYDTSNEQVTVNFPLYNTIYNSSLTDPWEKNYRLISNLAFKNLPYKISMFRYKTPTLYSVLIPGSKYIMLGYMSKFSVTNQGTSRYLQKQDGHSVLVPEIWNVSITFDSLLHKSANFFNNAMLNGPTVITSTNTSSLISSSITSTTLIPDNSSNEAVPTPTIINSRSPGSTLVPSDSAESESDRNFYEQDKY